MTSGKGRMFILVSGRWDAEISVVDLEAALLPSARGTDAAVRSRPRVTPDVATATQTIAACGLPVNILAAPDLGRIFVVNHGGNAGPETTAQMPHGHRGAVAVLDAEKAVDPENDGNLGALVQLFDSGGGGPVGCARTPDGRHLLVTSAEGEGSEDGGYRINVFSMPDGRFEHSYALRHEGRPSSRPSPDDGFGGFPNPNGIAVTGAHGGLVFTANGGTNDVSVVRLQALLSGEPGAEVARIALPSGGFGLALNADGTLLAVANRESARTGLEGNTVSIIDTGAAVSVATVLTGTDDPAAPSRPTGLAFSPDGTLLFVTCMRTGTLSCIHVADALAGGRGERQRVQLEAPRGVLVTPDGRFVIAAGGFRGEPRSGLLWILDANTLAEVGRVSGVGNEPYFIEAVAI